MKFNQALGSGNVLVGDKVSISLDISAVLQASTAAQRDKSPFCVAGKSGAKRDAN